MNTSFLLLLMLSLGSLSPLAAASVQFYNPNRGAPLLISIKAKQYYAPDAIPVTVMVTNQSQSNLLINQRLVFNHFQRDGELIFIIRGPEGKPRLLKKVVTPAALKETDFDVITAGATIERGADLADLFGLRKPGTYKIQVLYRSSADIQKHGLKSWRGVAASEPTEIIVK